MKIGIIGLPMCGKTTLFRLLTGGQGVGGGAPGGRAELRQAVVADPRLDRLSADYSPKKITPATIDFLDFPPIVRAGQGDRKSCADLLAPAREATALILVVRAFESASVPVLGAGIDPRRELEEIVEELRLADFEVAFGRRERVEKSLKKRRGEDKKRDEEEFELLGRIVAHLEAGGELRDLTLSSSEEKMIRGFQFLSGKPRLVVENVGEGSEGAVEDAVVVPAALELEVAELDDDDRATFVEEYALGEPARDRVITEIYRRAGLVSFLTAGEPEVRAWTIPAGTRAVDAAGAIHTDLSRGFIRAEVVSYADYVEDGGWNGAKGKGHFRLEGKDYLVVDGDIILFRFNV